MGYVTRVMGFILPAVKCIPKWEPSSRKTHHASRGDFFAPLRLMKTSFQGFRKQKTHQSFD